MSDELQSLLEATLEQQHEADKGLRYTHGEHVAPMPAVDMTPSWAFPVWTVLCKSCNTRHRNMMDNPRHDTPPTTGKVYRNPLSDLEERLQAADAKHRPAPPNEAPGRPLSAVWANLGDPLHSRRLLEGS